MCASRTAVRWISGRPKQPLNVRPEHGRIVASSRLACAARHGGSTGRARVRYTNNGCQAAEQVVKSGWADTTMVGPLPYSRYAKVARR